VRLQIGGSLPPDLDLDPAALGEALAGLAHELRLRDSTVPEYDLETLAQEGTLRGHFVRTLYARLEGAPEEEKDVIRRALYLGLDALAGRTTPR
jgi:hypothetical protein